MGGTSISQFLVQRKTDILKQTSVLCLISQTKKEKGKKKKKTLNLRFYISDQEVKRFAQARLKLLGNIFTQEVKRSAINLKYEL